MELFVNYCRLCRTEGNPTESWSQLTESGNAHLLDKIQACTGVQILKDDGLPTRICSHCEASLNQADTFRKQCQESNAWWTEKLVKPASTTSIYVKPEIVEEDELKGSSSQPGGVETVFKEEPIKFEDSDYEPAKYESSSDETKKDSSKKKKKAKTKKRGRTDFRCSVCSKQFTQRSTLDEHEARHTGAQNIECMLCNSKFFGAPGLKRHMDRKHPTNLPFQCDKCDRKFAKERHLAEHQAIHLEARPFSCELCSKAFKTKTSLSGHMRSVHQPQEVKEERRKVYQQICVCSYCGKISSTVTNHNIHLRTHTGEKKYECQICYKRFSAQFSYRKHMLIHSDERPYQCEHCQKAFRQRHHLTTHIRGVHSNERPFQCRFCPMAFVTRQSMQFHEKTHGEPVVGMDGSK